MPEMMKRRMTVDDLDQSVAEKLDAQTQQLTESISSSIAAVSSAADQQVAQQVTELREDVDAIKVTLAQVTSALVDLRQDVKDSREAIAANTSKPAEETTSDERFQELAGKVDSVSEDVRRMEDVLNAFRSEVDVSSIFNEPRAAIQKQSDAAQEAISVVKSQMDGLVQTFEASSQEALESFGKKADAAISFAEERMAGISEKTKAEMDSVTESYKASANQIERKINENTLDKFWTGGTIAGVVIVVFGIIATGILYVMMSHFDVSDDVSQIQSTTNRIIWNQYYPAVYPGSPNARMYSPFERGFNDAWNNQFQVERNAAMQAEQQNQQSK